MDKCRICLKSRKHLRLITDTEDDVTFLDMITSLNIKMQDNNTFPDKLCLLCRRRLSEAYNFKIDVERSEAILNESINLKRINFNNISDVKIKIEVDCKPIVTVTNNSSEDLFLNGKETLSYNETIIKKIKHENNEDQKTQLTVKEFLNTVKMESDDNGCNDNDFEFEAEYDPASDSDYEYGKPIRTKKKTSKKIKNEAIKSKKKIEIKNVIKPILLTDVKIDHSQVTKKRKIKRKYKRCPETSVCPYCGKILNTHYLDNHILQHTSDRPFKCEQCPKTFVTEQTLRGHIKLHSGERAYKCSECIATFNCKTALKSHMLVHSDQKTHVCEICSKPFKRKNALLRHLVIHRFGKKAIQCELCPMTFNSPFNLRHHMRIHTGERPYKCEICSQPYSYKHDFNRHCFKKHGVYLKRRSVNIMNEEVLQQERALMKELALRAHGFIKDSEIPSVFIGPQGALAYEQAMAVAAKLIPVTSMDTSYNILT